jgi:ketopantoate reductase
MASANIDISKFKCAPTLCGLLAVAASVCQNGMGALQHVRQLFRYFRLVGAVCGGGVETDGATAAAHASCCCTARAGAVEGWPCALGQTRL